eukprot:TRINITY_DN361_c0_g1_i1.p2 TRINITY_DN361_c0_g1~~TRINITY_DN361_c0_g1_i1.p2  ORF type:complete len:216 (-),score=33.95 TRINITY_DN361_c0_g1_i1:134-781(-)
MGNCLRRTPEHDEHIAPPRTSSSLQTIHALALDLSTTDSGLVYFQILRTAVRDSGPPIPSRPTQSLVLEDVDAMEQECSVCMEPLDRDCVQTPCDHHFHRDCLQKYELTVRGSPQRAASCPLCRASLYAPLPLQAYSSSGRQIEVCSVPRPGSLCHFDRHYQFLSLGGFASKPDMFYLCTSNEDRKTAASLVMWTLECTRPCTCLLYTSPSPRDS